MVNKILFIGSGSEAFAIASMDTASLGECHLVFLDAIHQPHERVGHRTDLVKRYGHFGGSAYDLFAIADSEVVGVVRAIGDNGVWADWCNWHNDSGLSRKIITVIPPTVRLWLDVDERYAEDRYPGVVFHHNVYVGPNCRVGVGTILNTGCIIEHDCNIDHSAFVGPGAILCGGVSVHQLAFIGAGARIAPGVTIGARQFVKMGTVVSRDLPDLAEFRHKPVKS